MNDLMNSSSFPFFISESALAVNNSKKTWTIIHDCRSPGVRAYQLFSRRMQFSRQNVRARHQLQLTVDGEDVCVGVGGGGGRGGWRVEIFLKLEVTSG